MRLPVLLRGAPAASLDYSRIPCGPNCLLTAADPIALLPPGVGPLVSDHCLLVTSENRVVKRRGTGEPHWSSWWNSIGISFSLSNHDLAQLQRPGFVAFDRHCDCSWSAALLTGRIMASPRCGHYRRLAARFSLVTPDSDTQAEQFLRHAWELLESLHSEGICHGDPTHYNLLLANDGALYWLDTDRLLISDHPRIMDAAVFIAHTAAPLLEPHSLHSLVVEILDKTPSTHVDALVRLLGIGLADLATDHHQQRCNLQSIHTQYSARLIFSQELSQRWTSLPAEHEIPQLTAPSSEHALSTITAVAQERERLIASLDAVARQNAERAAVAENTCNHLRRQLEDTASAIAEFANQRELLHALEAVAQERSTLIASLDATACEATKRAAVAEDARRHLEAQLTEAAALASEAVARSDHAMAQLTSLEAVAGERAALITTLDATARQAIERAVGAEDALRRLNMDAVELQTISADLAAQAMAINARADHLEQVAAERATLIERLDGMARTSGQRAESLEELTRIQATSLAEWQARALSDEQQLVELAATAVAATERAQVAEQARDARQVVIDELARARDALSAALAARPQPTWLGRLFFKKPL